MAHEIELKLTVSTSVHGTLVGWLDANAQAAGSVELTDVYYDMRDWASACNRAALRVRRQGSRWLQTLKIAAVSTSGLSIRHEWEVSLQNDALSVDVLVANNAVEVADYVRPHVATFAPLFRTDFTRRPWRVGIESDEIETVSDTGATLIPGTQACEPIDGLELEWKPADDSTLGEDTIAERLHAWMQALRTAVSDLTPLDISKAQRGHQLREKAVGGQT